MTCVVELDAFLIYHVFVCSKNNSKLYPIFVHLISTHRLLGLFTCPTATSILVHSYV
jgi:hypothetical protein